jgi:CTP synthase (UTP-ammonia lyase)
LDEAVRIGVVGDYNPEFESHPAIARSLEHAAGKLGRRVETLWAPTEKVTRENAGSLLGKFHGVWIAPGSPYRSMAGALAAIEFARLNGWPFYGT